MSHDQSLLAYWIGNRTRWASSIEAPTKGHISKYAYMLGLAHSEWTHWLYFGPRVLRAEPIDIGKYLQ